MGPERAKGFPFSRSLHTCCALCPSRSLPGFPTHNFLVLLHPSTASGRVSWACRVGQDRWPLSLPLNYGHLQQAPVPSLGERRRLFAFWGCAVTWSSSDSRLARSCTRLCRGFLSLCVCLVVGVVVVGGGVSLFIDLLLITPERIQVGRGLQRRPPSLSAGASERVE